MESDLSEDLVEEILSRVPATSLKRLRSACKQWNALFKDEIFAKKHFDKAVKQFMVLMLKENRVYSINANLHGIASPSIELYLKDSKNNTLKDFYISQIFHCDGLLLCTNNNNDGIVVVWNPFLGETRWIQTRTVNKKWAYFALGYQKDTSSSCRKYKILKYWSHKDQNGRFVYEFEIFELSSGTWRVLDLVNPDECIFCLLTSVSLKGNTYWVAYTKVVLCETILLSFDFSTERFTRLCLPFKDSYVSDTMALSVAREDKLVLLHQDISTLKLDIWVTTNIDQTKDLSWSKFLAVNLYTCNCLFSDFVTFFIDEEKKVAMCFGKEDNKNIVCIIGEDDSKYREFPLEESTYKLTKRPFVCNYVPSLVKIKQTVM